MSLRSWTSTVCQLECYNHAKPHKMSMLLRFLDLCRSNLFKRPCLYAFFHPPFDHICSPNYDRYHLHAASLTCLVSRLRLVRMLNTCVVVATHTLSMDYYSVRWEIVLFAVVNRGSLHVALVMPLEGRCHAAARLF